MLRAGDQFPTIFSTSLSLLDALLSKLTLTFVICLAACHFNPARKNKILLIVEPYRLTQGKQIFDSFMENWITICIIKPVFIT